MPTHQVRFRLTQATCSTDHTVAKEVIVVRARTTSVAQLSEWDLGWASPHMFERPLSGVVTLGWQPDIFADVLTPRIPLFIDLLSCSCMKSLVGKGAGLLLACQQLCTYFHIYTSAVLWSHLWQLSRHNRGSEEVHSAKQGAAVKESAAKKQGGFS